MVTGNWGVAILLVTLVLKLLFYPLSEASGKTSAKMRALQPRIKNIQEQFKGDKEKQGRATMELYQREKVNPVGGCLPTLVTIPVFLAFYWVLQESVEMRQAPFMLWLNDLSSPDPIYILPALMAAAMFVQQRLSPMSPDPVQAKVMMFMPIVMSALFATFPSAWCSITPRIPGSPYCSSGTSIGGSRLRRRAKPDRRDAVPVLNAHERNGHNCGGRYAAGTGGRSHCASVRTPCAEHCRRRAGRGASAAARGVCNIQRR